jgi:hypothetical protein
LDNVFHGGKLIGTVITLGDLLEIGELYANTAKDIN